MTLYQCSLLLSSSSLSLLRGMKTALRFRSNVVFIVATREVSREWCDFIGSQENRPISLAFHHPGITCQARARTVPGQGGKTTEKLTWAKLCWTFIGRCLRAVVSQSFPEEDSLILSGHWTSVLTNRTSNQCVHLLNSEGRLNCWI